MLTSYNCLQGFFLLLIMFVFVQDVLFLLIYFNPHRSSIKLKNEFKSNENIHKKEDGSYYIVSANKVSSVTL